MHIKAEEAREVIRRTGSDDSPVKEARSRCAWENCKEVGKGEMHDVGADFTCAPRPNNDKGNLVSADPWGPKRRLRRVWALKCSLSASTLMFATFVRKVTTDLFDSVDLVHHLPVDLRPMERVSPHELPKRQDDQEEPYHHHGRVVHSTHRNRKFRWEADENTQHDHEQGGKDVTDVAPLAKIEKSFW